MKHVCALCGYVYNSAEGDPDNGVTKGTDFEDISADWVCPLCGASKEDFDLIEDGDVNENDEF